MTTLIQRGSTDFRDYEWRGAAYASKRQFDLALADFNQAVSLSGHGWYPHAKRAEILADRGEHDRALMDLNSAIGEHKANEAWVFFRRGDIHLRKETYDLAWDDFTKVVEFAPDVFDGYLGRGLTETRRTHALIEHCRKIQSDRKDKRNTLDGGPCTRPISFDAALADFRTVLAKKPDLAQAHFEIGRIMFHENRWQDAVQAYTDAIRANPNFANAYNNRGAAYSKLKKRELAFADFNEAIRLDQRLPAAWINRGDMFAGNGQRQEAIAAYRKALDIDGNHSPALDRLKKLGLKP